MHLQPTLHFASLLPELSVRIATLRLTGGGKRTALREQVYHECNKAVIRCIEHIQCNPDTQEILTCLGPSRLSFAQINV